MSNVLEHRYFRNAVEASFTGIGPGCRWFCYLKRGYGKGWQQAVRPSAKIWRHPQSFLPLHGLFQAHMFWSDMCSHCIASVRKANEGLSPRFGAERAWAVHIFVSKPTRKNMETCAYWHDWPKCSGFWMFRASTSKQKHAIYSDLLHDRNLKGSKPRCASSFWQQMQITKKYSNAPSFIFVTLAIGTWEMPLNLAGSGRELKVNVRRLGPQACACMLMSPRDSMAGCFFRRGQSRKFEKAKQLAASKPHVATFLCQVNCSSTTQSPSWGGLDAKRWPRGGLVGCPERARKLYAF